jgi:hypothetical protein
VTVVVEIELKFSNALMLIFLQLHPTLPTSRDNSDLQTWRDRNSWEGKLQSIFPFLVSHCYVNLLMYKGGAGLRGVPDWLLQALSRI